MKEDGGERGGNDESHTTPAGTYPVLGRHCKLAKATLVLLFVLALGTQLVVNS